MAVLYDSAARVQEIIDLKIKDLRLDKLAVITLHGKGRKNSPCSNHGKTKNLLESHLRCSSSNNGMSCGESMCLRTKRNSNLHAGVYLTSLISMSI